MSNPSVALAGDIEEICGPMPQIDRDAVVARVEAGEPFADLVKPTATALSACADRADEVADSHFKALQTCAAVSNNCSIVEQAWLDSIVEKLSIEHASVMAHRLMIMQVEQPRQCLDSLDRRLRAEGVLYCID